MDGEEHTGDADKFQAELDGNYCKWKSRYQRLLKAALLVVWAPSILFILTAMLAVAYPAQDHGPMVIFHLSLVFGSIIVNGILATAVAIVAGASWEISPNILSDYGMPNGYARFRRFIRLVSMKWIAWLMLAPTCVGILIWQFFNIAVDPSAHTQGQHPGDSNAYVVAVLLFLVPLLGCSYGWCLLELAQFLNLRFTNFTTATRVWVSLLSIGVFFVLVVFWPFVGGTLLASPKMDWLASLGGTLVYVIPLGLAFYMMLATCKPNSAMLQE